MKFNETELSVLRNFSKINPSQIINPTGFCAKKVSNSIVGFYNFEEPYDFETFGIYEITTFLQVLDTFNSPDVTIEADRVLIKEGSSKAQYFTTPLDLLKQSEVPADLPKKFAKLDCEIDFDLSADKLATIMKTASVFRAKYLFIESDADNDLVKLTVSSDSPGTSANSFDISIRENVRKNELAGQIIKFPLSELTIIPGDYKIEISSKKISRWSCFNGVDYFVGCMIEN